MTLVTVMVKLVGIPRIVLLGIEVEITGAGVGYRV
jgi:hypothetical protein